jgi:cyclase
MLKTRVIPCLLLLDDGLVKTVKFKSPKYVGDPINAVKIFNEKEVDELIFLDISATSQNRKPNFTLINEIATECFMPLCYGGGVKTIEDIRILLKLGVEKVSINTSAIQDPTFISKAAATFGSSTIVVSMDIKKNIWGKYYLYTQRGQVNTNIEPVDFAERMEKAGAGEILINSVDYDGTMKGYDLPIIKRITDTVSIPVIATGGAGKLEDFKTAVEQGGVSAVAAGSMFVFIGAHKAVLINYPKPTDLNKYLK